MSMLETPLEALIQHPHEEQSNAVRRRLAACQPRSLRTYTSSLAVLDRSAGAFHWTPEGRKLADFTSGVLVANLGHHPARWWRRLLRYQGVADVGQAAPTAEYFAAPPLTAYNAVTDLEVLASERLIDSLRSEPGGQRMEQVLWAASGSEAIQKALWCAMHRHPGQDMIVATRWGFHGKKGLAGAVTGCEEDPERDPRVRFISFPREQCRNLQRRAAPIDLSEFRHELETLSHQAGDKLCCLITEPYLGGGGSFHPQPEYLQLLQQFCRDHDILFILDEIQANFGRTGPMYAFTHYGLEPDIVCLGKGLGNGVPVSAAVGSRQALSTLHFGATSDTWSANPLSAAAVLATLDEFAETNVIEQGRQLSRIIQAGLLGLSDTGLIAHVRGEGCVWGLECGPCGQFSAEAVANACVRACYLGDPQGRAIHLLGPLAGKVLRISPPLTMRHDDAREYFQVFHDILAALAARLKAGQ